MKLWAKTLTLALFTFLTGYIFISGGFLFYSIHETEKYSYDSTRTFLKKNKQIVTNIIFSQIFAEAKRCLGAPQKNKEQCEKEVTYRLATTIIEEDFKNSYGVDWPTDLFFVKESPTETARLGWEGKYIDITNIYQKNWINSPLFIRNLQQKCHIFNYDQMTASNCEIFEKIPLSNNETGYIVRLIGLGEELDIRFALFIPILLIFNLPSILAYIPQAIYYRDAFFFFPLTLLGLLFAVLALSISVGNYYYKKHEKKVKEKVLHD